MLKYAQLFVDYLDMKGVKYTVVDERTVKVVYNGDNLDSIPVFVFFDKDGDNLVAFKCWDIANFKNNPEKGINACNELNASWRWVKFFIDKDFDVVADIDAMVDDRTCGEICLSLVRRVVSIVDDAYPTLAKARWA